MRMNTTNRPFKSGLGLKTMLLLLGFLFDSGNGVGRYGSVGSAGGSATVIADHLPSMKLFGAWTRTHTLRAVISRAA